MNYFVYVYIHSSTVNKILIIIIRRRSLKCYLTVMWYLFEKILLLPPYIVYRSAIMSVENLLRGMMPMEIKECIDKEDKKKLIMCAHDVVKDNPHSLIQLMIMEIMTMQRAITRALATRNFLHNVLPRTEVTHAMKDYFLQKCYLCGFDLDNRAIIPYRESVEFCLRKLYMREYCRNVYQASPGITHSLKDGRA